MNSNYYETKNEILSYLEHGDNLEREKAITSIFWGQKLNQHKEYYDLLWEVFLSDEYFNVRKHALIGVCLCKPKKCLDILEFLVKEDYYTKRENQDTFTLIVARSIAQNKEEIINLLRK